MKPLINSDTFPFFLCPGIFGLVAGRGRLTEVNGCYNSSSIFTTPSLFKIR